MKIEMDEPGSKTVVRQVFFRTHSAQSESEYQRKDLDVRHYYYSTIPEIHSQKNYDKNRLPNTLINKALFQISGIPKEHSYS